MASTAGEIAESSSGVLQRGTGPGSLDSEQPVSSPPPSLGPVPHQEATLSSPNRRPATTTASCRFGQLSPPACPTTTGRRDWLRAPEPSACLSVLLRNSRDQLITVHSMLRQRTGTRARAGRARRLRHGRSGVRRFWRSGRDRA